MRLLALWSMKKITNTPNQSFDFSRFHIRYTSAQSIGNLHSIYFATTARHCSQRISKTCESVTEPFGYMQLMNSSAKLHTTAFLEARLKKNAPTFRKVFL